MKIVPIHENCQNGSLMTYQVMIERVEQFLEYLPQDDAGSADSRA